MRCYHRVEITVSLGGTLLEIAVAQERTRELLRWAADSGIDAIEVSNGLRRRSPDQRAGPGPPAGRRLSGARRDRREGAAVPVYERAWVDEIVRGPAPQPAGVVRAPVRPRREPRHIPWDEVLPWRPSGWPAGRHRRPMVSDPRRIPAPTRTVACRCDRSTSRSRRPRCAGTCSAARSTAGPTTSCCSATRASRSPWCVRRLASRCSRPSSRRGCSLGQGRPSGSPRPTPLLAMPPRSPRPPAQRRRHGRTSCSAASSTWTSSGSPHPCRCGSPRSSRLPRRSSTPKPSRRSRSTRTCPRCGSTSTWSRSGSTW